MPKTIVRKKPSKIVKKRKGSGLPKVTILRYSSEDPKSLNLYYKNPRIGNVEKVAESLAENGQFKPIVVNIGNKTGRLREVLAGNHTLKGTLKLKWSQIEVAWVDVDEAKARQIVLADNGASDDSRYDDSVLTELLAQQKDEVGTLVGTTYDDGVLSRLVKEVGDDSEHAGVDTIEDASEELAGVSDLANGIFFPSSLPYEFPELLPSMIPDECPTPIDVYAGHELDGKSEREDYDDVTWLAVWHTGCRGINWQKAIPCFYCVDEATETLTQRGWVNGKELHDDDVILSMRQDGKLAWSSIKSIFRKPYSGKMHRITKNNIDALVTPGHKLPLVDGSLVPVEALGSHDVLRVFGEAEESTANVYTDAFVEVVGWAVTEGNYRGNAIVISQKTGNEGPVRQAIKRSGFSWTESTSGSCTCFYIHAEHGKKIQEAAPGRVLSMDFLLALSTDQRLLLVGTMVSGDGWKASGSNTRCYTQKDWKHTEAFITLCTLAGIPTSVSLREWETSFGFASCYVVNLKVEKVAHVRSLDFHGGRGDFRKGMENFPVEDYEGMVWCPTTEFGTFVVRRNGIVYVTGNTDDFHFEPVYNDPAKNTKKILNLGMKIAMMPNYTIMPEMPIAMWVWAYYRSLYVARYFQEAGLQVIPDIQTGSSDEALDITLLGIPQNCGVVSAQVQTTSQDEKTYIRQKARLLKEAEDRLGFKSILLYGYKAADEVAERADFSCQVIRVQNRTARRRAYLNSEATINSQKIQAKKKKRVVKKKSA